MTRAQKRKTPKKRGPKEDRLVISEDPADAQGRLLKATRAAKTDFDAAHQDGMAALQDHNIKAVSEAVKREIEAMTKLSDTIRETTARAKGRA